MDTVTDTSQDTEPAGAMENWFLLMDPAWHPKTEDETPPIEAVVGMWPVESDGTLGKFRANPEHVPSDAESPTDPLDAVLRLVMQQRAEAEHIQLMLRDSLFDIAMNGDGRPLIMNSPDQLQCVVIATGELHRQRVSAPDWRRIDLEELVVLLADGIDVFFNPGSPAAVRLTGDFIRETLMLDDERAAELYAEHQEATDLQVAPWSPPGAVVDVVDLPERQESAVDEAGSAPTGSAPEDGVSGQS
ncbi:type VII secretion system-associated protein [Lentzea sp. NBRC 102530]|uniref:type VII secretion system-associated protein n=1 Tax=Lentzea sp. NBRC 102530 TaxID=3032201 RepID=UPI0024A4D5F8|nr:type VII secretion system-associated protein [Lentzea sp. NBRC 102530]GLY54513.1 hypothetical protein Lesp01_81680 [Lentzea sp. NBRC 102530]